MIDMCNYIDWSLRSGLELNFELSEEDLRLVEVCVEASSYYDLGAYPESIYYPVYEFF